jgi:hypothetical protein
MALFFLFATSFYPVLLGVVRHIHLLSDLCLGTKVYRLCGGILLEPREDLTLGLQEIDPGLPGVVIYESAIILTTT